MAKSRKKTYKSRKVDVDLGELQAIVNATSERVLTEEEHKKLMESHQLLADLILPDLQSETSDALKGGEKPESKEKPPRKRPEKNGGRRPRTDFKAATTVEVPVTEYRVGQPCPCGCGGKLYDYSRVSHFRHFVGQAPIRVTLYELKQMRSNGCGMVYVADLPEGVGPEPYDATAVSTIALNRYGVGLPFYRQAKQLEIMGTPISSSSQYKVVLGAIAKLQPVYDHLVKLAVQGKVMYFDDTSMKILDFVRPEGDKRTGLFTTGVVSVTDLGEIALLFTGCEHAGENRAKLLAQRSPDLKAMILMSDALASNFVGAKDDDLIANCMVHGRRYFVKTIDTFPQDCQKVIEAIGEVYYNDGFTKGYTDEQRLAYHQQHSAPIMAELKTWLDEHVAAKKSEPSSKLGKAIAYLRTHWKALTLFLHVPGAPLDNNVAERLLKSVVLHRKNSLFYRTAAGAKTGDVYMSLIQTCQRNGINPWDYLTELQRNHEAAKLAPADWLPWTYQLTLARDTAAPPKPPPPGSTAKIPTPA